MRKIKKYFLQRLKDNLSILLKKDNDYIVFSTCRDIIYNFNNYEPDDDGEGKIMSDLKKSWYNNFYNKISPYDSSSKPDDSSSKPNDSPFKFIYLDMITIKSILK